MAKQIENGYINFSIEVESNMKSVVKSGFGKTISWAAMIINYKTAKEFKREYFDFEDFEIEVNKINVGDVLNLRNEVKVSHKYSNQCDIYVLILEIENENVEMEYFDTVASAIKAQNKFRLKQITN